MARILVVDDREQDRYLFVSLLTAAGHQAFGAADGVEALALAREMLPDLAVSDIFMPRMDGFALCQQWRLDERLRDRPFIFYTATYTGEDDERFARSLGADAFLIKPCEGEELLAAINDILQRAQAGLLTKQRAKPPADPEFALHHGQTVSRKLEAKVVELEQTNARLYEAEGRFRALVEQSLAGIYTVRGDGKIDYCNPRFAQIFGTTVEALLDRPFFALASEADRPMVREVLAELLAGRRTSAEFEFGARRSDGRVIAIGAHGAPGWQAGQVSVIGMLQDISAQKESEARIQEHIAQLRTAMHGAVRMVSTVVELRDPYTAGHEQRVADMAMAIGRGLGVDGDMLDALDVIGQVHDVGKISVPAEILNRPGRLSEVEFALIREHPEQGRRILTGIDFPWPVAEIVAQHHERLDGSGYPNGLSGEAILPASRILAVADVVEAMLSHRPYRTALSLDAALAEIEAQAGRTYDADVVATCCRLFREQGYTLPRL